MVAEIEKLARELRGRNHLEAAGVLTIGAQIARKLGVPEFLQVEAIKVYPEISLEDEWQRQSHRFVDLGFHKELNLTEEKYFESLPEFTVQPESFKKGLKSPLLRETRIPIERKCQLTKVEYLLRGLSQSDWSNDPQKYKTPDLPYTIWTDEGARFVDMPVRDVRKELALDERGGTAADGIDLYIAKPSILKIRSLDFPGTSVGAYDAAYLDLWMDVPWLENRFVGDPAHKSGFGALICSRQ